MSCVSMLLILHLKRNQIFETIVILCVTVKHCKFSSLQVNVRIVHALLRSAVLGMRIFMQRYVADLMHLVCILHTLTQLRCTKLDILKHFCQKQKGLLKERWRKFMFVLISHFTLSQIWQCIFVYFSPFYQFTNTVLYLNFYKNEKMTQIWETLRVKSAL